MKNILKKAVKSLLAVIPVVAVVAMVVSANNIASPYMGQPTPPKNLREYRKF